MWEGRSRGVMGREMEEGERERKRRYVRGEEVVEQKRLINKGGRGGKGADKGGNLTKWGDRGRRGEEMWRWVVKKKK